MTLLTDDVALDAPPAENKRTQKIEAPRDRQDTRMKEKYRDCMKSTPGNIANTLGTRPVELL